LEATYIFNFIQSIYAWGQTTMDGKQLVIDDSSQCQVIKYFSAVTPNVNTAKLS
jgi:hypothetical protein